jgi:RNA polymerase sigma-70 factor, ECF subfamily
MGGSVAERRTPARRNRASTDGELEGTPGVTDAMHALSHHSMDPANAGVRHAGGSVAAASRFTVAAGARKGPRSTVLDGEGSATDAVAHPTTDRVPDRTMAAPGTSSDRGGTGVRRGRSLSFGAPRPAMDRPATSDDLLVRIAAGDRTAVETCLARYGALVWSVVRSVISDTDLAEDAVQEAFVDLWLKAARFDPSKSSEAGFVALVARRRAIDAVRRRARRTRDVGQEDPNVVAVEHEGHAGVDRDDEVELVYSVLAELRPEQQRVLRLSLLDGLSHSQISEHTGMPLGTVKTHARRGLSQAREILESRRAAPGAGGRA